MEKYYIITSFYGHTSVETYEKKEDWLKAINLEALNGAPGKDDKFKVGYITNPNYELCVETERFNTFKSNKKGGHYYANSTSLFAKKIGQEEEYKELEEIEFAEQNVYYYSIYKREETDEEGNKILIYYDEAGEEYETEAEAIEENNPSLYLTI